MKKLNIKKLERTVKSEWKTFKKEPINNILDKYGRKWKKDNSRLMFCHPTKAEIEGRKKRINHPGNDGKVIYDTLEIATAASVEFQKIGLGGMEPYPCKRSKSGHWHLTTKREYEESEGIQENR